MTAAHPRHPDCAHAMPPSGCPATGHSSYNHKDSVGEGLFNEFVVVAVFVFVAFILMVAFLVSYFKGGSPTQSFSILGGSLVCFAVAVGFGVDVAIKARDDPMCVLYAFNQLVTKSKTTPPVMDPSSEPVSAELEANFETIKKEVNALLSDGELLLTRDSTSNEEIGRDVKFSCPPESPQCSEEEKQLDGWKIMMVSVGKTVSEQGQYFLPKLVEITQRYKVASVVVSSLPAKTEIPVHCGYTPMVKRLMLAITVPRDADNCYLCVNTEKLTWTEGKCLLWDDTFYHAVKNNTEETRVVVYMDVIRETGNWVLDGIIRIVVKMIQGSSYVQDEVKRTEYKVKIR